jgi:exoribonuclease R
MGVTQAGLLEPTPQAYQQILASVRGTPQESAVNSLLLRSLRQAKYSSENKGILGLHSAITCTLPALFGVTQICWFTAS